jgi:hypothetical protein
VVKPDKLPRMRKVLLGLLLVCICTWAAPKERPWQDAQVVKVEQSEVAVEQDIYRSSAPSGSVGTPLPTGSETHRKKIFTYDFKTDQHHYLAKVEKKPLDGIQEGSKVRIYVQKDVLAIEMPGGKERKLELTKTD